MTDADLKVYARLAEITEELDALRDDLARRNNPASAGVNMAAIMLTRVLVIAEGHAAWGERHLRVVRGEP